MQRRRPGATDPARDAGFTYVGLLIAVAILGLGLSVVGTVWHTQAQREREQELLSVGREFRAAIAAYYRSGGHQFPQDINDLLEDKRGPEPRHYLRRLYADPITGNANWTLLRGDSLGISAFAGITGIIGIASSSQAEPLKKKGFPVEEVTFEDAACYCDWKFVYVPRILLRRANLVPPAAD
jgi:type II secretory pathway pseudopilin PulG